MTPAEAVTLAEIRGRHAATPPQLRGAQGYQDRAVLLAALDTRDWEIGRLRDEITRLRLLVADGQRR
jgi:hypothetical protein